MLQKPGREANGLCEEISIPGVDGGLAGLEKYFKRHGVTKGGREIVLAALTGPPVRRVGGGGGNVIVRYASRKMGRVIQAESRTIELAFVELCEFDSEVRFYLCQPGKIFVRRKDSRGHTKGHWVTPDYLVLDGSGFALVECKPVSALRRDAAGVNPRFVRDASGWRWPAAEEAAVGLGFGFRVFSSEKINPTWHRNTRFLEDFLEIACPEPENARALVKELSKAGSMRICEVLALSDVKPETLWWLIARDAVWADLECELLCESDMSSVHSSKSRMIASRHRHSSVSDAALSHRISTVRVEPGAKLLWNLTNYTVLNRTPEDVVLRPDTKGGECVSISMEDLKGFLGRGAISGDQSKTVDSILRRRDDLLLHASDKAVEQANQCYAWLMEFRETGKVPAGTSPRSIRRYEACYRKGERVYGFGYFGFIQRRGRRPGKSDLGEKQQQVLEEVVKKFIKDRKAGRLSNAYARLKALCKERGISPVPCSETLRLEIKRKPKHEVVRDREGERAVYQVCGPWVTQDPVIPRVADRVWQVAHVDHVLVDVQLASGRTGAPLGMAWLTLMIDDQTRMPLAMWLSFDEPSRVAVCKVLHDCVIRHGRVPDNIVVDQGSEFNSIDVEGVFGALEINKVERPAGKPRFGAVMERMFGTANVRLIHELPGNTRLAVRGRSLSSTHDPKRNASLSLRALNEILEEWLFDEYPELIHKKLGRTPREVFRDDLAYSGERTARHVANDESLRMILALTPDRPTRRVAEGGTITVAYLRYFHKALLTGDVVGSNVSVKLDAQDSSVVFAWVRGEWVTCVLTDGNADLGGRSRKEMKLLVEELRQQYRKGAEGGELNAEKIGHYLLRKEYGEKVARQIERDAEARSISRAGSVEEEAFLPEEEFSEVPVVESNGVSADNAAEAVDRDDALTGAKSLKVLRK